MHTRLTDPHSQFKVTLSECDRTVHFTLTVFTNFTYQAKVITGSSKRFQIEEIVNRTGPCDGLFVVTARVHYIHTQHEQILNAEVTGTF